MAEFGIPHNRGDREEALAAVRAALAMQSNLDSLNKTLEAEGLEPLARGSNPSASSVLFRLSRLLCIARAARTAARASSRSPRLWGMPNSAINASPMNLSSSPCSCRTGAEIASK